MPPSILHCCSAWSSHSPLTLSSSSSSSSSSSFSSSSSSIWLRTFSIFPGWLYRESITTGVSSFCQGTKKQMEDLPHVPCLRRTFRKARLETKATHFRWSSRPARSASPTSPSPRGSSRSEAPRATSFCILFGARVKCRLLLVF